MREKEGGRKAYTEGIRKKKWEKKTKGKVEIRKGNIRRGINQPHKDIR